MLEGSDNLIKFGNARERISRDLVLHSAKIQAPGARPSIGLALGSGAIRGFAHIGFISEIRKTGAAIGEIAGSSIGAIMGCLFAGGMDLDLIERIAPEIGRNDIFDPGLPYLSFFRGEKLKKLLVHLFHHKLGVRRLEALKIKVFVTAVDIHKGIPVIFREGGIVDVLMASCSVPMAFSPYRAGSGTFVDGGVLLPLPASVLRGRGHDAVVAINLGFGNLYSDVGNIFKVAGQTIVTMGRKLVEIQAEHSDVTVTPDFGKTGYWEFDKIKNIIEVGKKAAREAAPKILAAAGKKAGLRRELTGSAS